MSVTLEQARAAKEQAKLELSRWIPFVNGIGLTKVDNEWTISVGLLKPISPEEGFPQLICGVRITSDVIGEVGALRIKLLEAQRNNWSFAKTLLRVVIGEVDTLSARNSTPINDEQVHKIIRKLITSNLETMGEMKKVGREKEEKHALLIEENVYLETLLPKMPSQDELKKCLGEIKDKISAATNDGQATGIAIKYLKSKALAFSGDEVSKIVKALRSDA